LLQKNDNTPFQYGGQAVIEGVMMRGPEKIATAVRVGEEIVIQKENVAPWTEAFSFFKWPLVRGVIVLIESMVIGIKTLSLSASLVSGEDEDESLGAGEIAVTLLLALLFAVGLFILLPTWLGHLARFQVGIFGQNLIEGVTRLGIFLLYILAIRRLEDIRRVFQYHGAEHKAINTYEEGAELTVDEVAQRSRLHPSCGTSFLLIILVISILVFACLGDGPWWWKFGTRIFLLPLIAGLGYEFVRFSRRHRERMGILIAPGLWLQNLTTGEPDDEQIEVAIAALKSVLVHPVSRGA
jgi:uncharacterized protein YqhQ